MLRFGKERLGPKSRHNGGRLGGKTKSELQSINPKVREKNGSNLTKEAGNKTGVT